MTRRRQKLVVFIAVLAAVVVGGGRGFAMEANWTDDYEAAKKKAAAEKKDILLEFTGSDWCPGCIVLRRTVLFAEPFVTEGPKQFMLVEVDMPKDRSKQSAALQRQNVMLHQEHRTEQYPTLILMDSQARAYAKISYTNETAEEYMKKLAALREVKATRDKMLAEAEKAQGVERAKLLDAVIVELEKYGVEPTENEAWVQEIVGLDTDGKAGLRDKYRVTLRMHEVEKVAAGGDVNGALEKTDAMIKELKPTGQDAQDVYFFRSSLQYRKQDLEGSKESLRLGIAAAPEGKRAMHMQTTLKILESAGGPAPAPEH